MLDKEFKEVEKEIIKALTTFSDQNSINEERLFRKKFHTSFFEKLKQGWNNNEKIKSKISIKYGLIHNSIHCNNGDKSCEIGDFLFVVRNCNANYDYFAKSLLIQVKPHGNIDNNYCQKNLYANWPKFSFSRPKNELFLNDNNILNEINIKKYVSQSVYFEYSKDNINSAKKYVIKEIKSLDSNFELYDEKYFSNFLLNLIFKSEGRSFFYSEDYNLEYKKFYRRKNILNKILNDFTCGIQFSDDWDFMINSILNYSNGKFSSNVTRQTTTNLNFISMTDNPKTIEEATEDNNGLRIVELQINN
jgi:hypothetical protein